MDSMGSVSRGFFFSIMLSLRSSLMEKKANSEKSRCGGIGATSERWASPSNARYEKWMDGSLRCLF